MRQLLGVRIEGIGQSSAKGGLCFFFGAHVPPGLAALEWVQGLVEIPGSISTSVDIFTGAWRTSAFTFPISYKHAPTLLASETLTERSLTAALDAADTTVELADVTLGGQAVYVGDETILLGTWDGVSGYAGCVRGLWGSEARPHRSGSFVYVRPPHWSMRRVEVWTLDVDTGAEVCRWRGYLQGRPTRRDGTRIEVSCEEYFATWRDATIPRRPTDLNAGRGLRVRGERWVDGPLVDADGVGSIPSTLASLASDQLVCAQLGGALVTFGWSASRQLLQVGVLRELLASQLKLDPPEEGRARVVLDEPVWELLVWDRLAGIGPTQGMTYVTDYHPARVALALLRSDPVLDNMAPGWGLGLTHLDWSAWEAEIARTPQLKIDQLIIGWDGDTTRVFEQVEQLLRSYGYLIAPKLDGSVDLVRFRTLSIGDYSQAVANRVTLYEGVLQLTPPEDVGLTELRATVGALPWRAGRPIVVQGRGSSERAALLSDARRWEIELGHVRAQDAVRVATELAESASLVHYGLPTLTIRVPDGVATGKDLDIGRLVALDPGTLRTSWFLDRGGQRIAPSDWYTRVDLVGWITGRKQSLEDLTVELELRLLAYYSGDYTRERAPAGVLSGAPAGALIYLEPDYLAGDPSDADTFGVGDQVELYSGDGDEIVGGPYTITAVGSDTVTVDATVTAGAAGDVLRLATSPYYYNAARYPVTGRPYVYLAAEETDQILALGDGPQPPDIYGAGLGLG